MPDAPKKPASTHNNWAVLPWLGIAFAVGNLAVHAITTYASTRSMHDPYTITFVVMTGLGIIGLTWAFVAMRRKQPRKP